MPISAAALEWSERRFRAMGTDVHLVLGCSTEGLSGTLLDTAELAVREAEWRWSRFVADSELSRINRSAGHITVVSEATFDLIEIALLARRTTDGAFDPTLGRQMDAVGYDTDFSSLDGGLRRRRVGFSRPGDRAELDRVELHRPSLTVLLPSRAGFDFGGIAKGYTADRVVEQLLALGADAVCANLGGDIRVHGPGPAAGGWKIGLACEGSTEDRAVNLAAGAVCTSSTSRRQWQTKDGPAHHLIDPETGTSRRDCPQTVVAIAATATAAEVVTKWMMAGGSPQRFGATGLSVAPDGTIHHHEGLEDFLSALDPGERARS